MPSTASFLILQVSWDVYLEDGDAVVVLENRVVDEVLTPLLTILGFTAEPQEISVLSLLYHVV